MSETYTIRPLEWKRRGYATREEWACTTIFLVGFAVWSVEPNAYLWVIGTGQPQPCDSIDEGKAAAEAHYRSRLLPALAETKGATHEK